MGSAVRFYLIAAGVVALVTMGSVLYAKIRADGANAVRIKQLEQTNKDVTDRARDDVKTQRLSDFDICIRDFGRVPECDTLR